MKISTRNKHHVLKELERLEQCIKRVADDIVASDEVDLKSLRMVVDRTFGLTLDIVEREA